MRKAHARALSVIAVLMHTACADDAPPGNDSTIYAKATGQLESPSMRWIVSPAGIGPVHIGMTVREVGRALGDSTFSPQGANSSCAFARHATMPPGTSLMLSDGRLVRVDVDSSGVVMDTGLRVGDSEVAVMVMHSGHVKVDSDKYRPAPAHVLTVSVPGDSTNAMVFTTDGSSITSFRVGRRSAVELVERCG